MELYNVVTYCTDLELIKKTLDERKFKYKGILHDRDAKKKPHVHLIISCEHEIAYRTLAEMLQNLFGQNVLVQGVKDFCEAEDYLCHEHSRTKAKYSQEEKFTNDVEFFKDLYTINYHRDDNLVEDLISGEWNVISLARKYGLDFVKNFKTYEYFHTIVVQQMEEERVSENEYIAKIHQREAEISLRAEEIQRISKEFGIPTDCIINWSYDDYVSSYDWVRKYKRDRRYNIVHTFVLRYLDEDTRLSMERLIYKRMSEGLTQIFDDTDPYHKSLAELRDITSRTLETPRFRRNIYVKSTEYFL